MYKYANKKVYYINKSGRRVFTDVAAHMLAYTENPAV